MGYRHYFGRIQLEDLEKLRVAKDNDELVKIAKTLTDDIDEEDGWVAPYDISEEVFEFGKLYWCDTVERMKAIGVDIYNSSDLMKTYRDYEPMVIVGRDGVLLAIEIYKENIVKYYQGLIDSEHNLDDEIRDLAKKKIFLIDYLVDTSDSKNKVTKSWEYEHSIFNLASILKNTNWEKETIMFYGR